MTVSAADIHWGDGNGSNKVLSLSLGLGPCYEHCSLSSSSWSFGAGYVHLPMSSPADGHNPRTLQPPKHNGLHQNTDDNNVLYHIHLHQVLLVLCSIIRASFGSNYSAPTLHTIG